MKLLKSVVCLFTGHKRLEVLKNDEHSPFGVGAKQDDTYYPMWPCDRCKSMYIEKETKVFTNKTFQECCKEKHVEVIGE